MKLSGQACRLDSDVILDGHEPYTFDLPDRGQPVVDVACQGEAPFLNEQRDLPTPIWMKPG